jgi:Prokaryotic cytochrome b561
MPFLSTRFRYGAAAQVFRWLTVILVVTAYFMGPGGSEQRVYSSAVDFTRQTHETLGVTVLALALIRLLWRLIDTAPEDPPMKPWTKYSAKFVYVVLYGLLIATRVPLLSARGWKAIRSRFGVSGTSGRCCRRPVLSAFPWLRSTRHRGILSCRSPTMANHLDFACVSARTPDPWTIDPISSSQ